MAEESKNNPINGGLIIAAVVGLAFAGLTQVQRINSTNTANLPATNANVEANSQAIIDLREQLTAAIEAAEDDASNDLANEAQLIRTEINRREPETLTIVDDKNDERKEDIAELREDLKELRGLLFDHINTPRASHSHE